MIGSFWNLCRACPSMPVDKLHSEYKSTYRWHEFSGPEVVRKPPVPNQFASSKDHFFSKSTENEKPTEATSGPINEPPLPRRKKNPELAYRSHEFIGGIDRTDAANRARVTAPHELEPLFRDEPDTKHEKRHIRPTYQFDKEKFGFEPDSGKVGGKLMNGHANHHDNNKNWVKEVLELRKKAGEYKTRAWGIEINPELAKKQAEVFDQISRRSSLSALSLEPTIKPMQNGTKETSKKDEKPPRPRVPGQARAVGMDRSLPDGLLIRAKVDNVRYHLGKGIDEDDISLLISPTREKLMPAIPKGSPQKTAKTMSPRSSPKKRVKVRSQSVGPTVSDRSGSPKKQVRSGSTTGVKSTKRTPVSTPTITVPQDGRRPRPTDDEHDSGTTTGPSSLPHPDVEHIIKSPPEPTRVKSPEQILMRSPDPVNWTVPLDTGKTFTVTQNVREGDNSIRPHSDFKASTPLGNAPLTSLLTVNSAPPSLDDQHKMMTTSIIQQTKPEQPASTTTAIPATSATATTTTAPAAAPTPAPTAAIAPEKPPAAAAAEKPSAPVPGNTIRCIEDPKFTADINSPLPPTTTTTATRPTNNEVIEEARDRFDKYWSKPESEPTDTKNESK
ncbi:uncharacterized protein LOC134833718 isoform X2 [Culicoides brevitarsis]|uniref:uncharacterized protein LOC134833718 isoform X2 n=1 Tax=Culicoides brevitarsis TaxID=469753 RepID=UPI00307C560F